MAFEAGETNTIDPATADVLALRARDSLDIQTIDGVFEHGPVREQGELLEDHRRLVTTEFAKLRRVHPTDIDAVIEHFARSRLDQPVDMPDERGLAGAGKTHDNGDAATGHLDVDVLQTQNVAMGLVQFRLRHAGLHLVDEGRPVRSEDLVKIADLDVVTSHGPPPYGAEGACHRPGWRGRR